MFCEAFNRAICRSVMYNETPMATMGKTRIQRGDPVTMLTASVRKMTQLAQCMMRPSNVNSSSS